MIYESYIPNPPLSGFIDNIVFYDGYESEHTANKLLPDGSIYILIDMEDSPKKVFFDEALTEYTEMKLFYVSGQQQRFICIDAQVSSMMVITFKIGGAFPFFDVPISNLNDKIESLEKYFGERFFEIRRKIILATEVSEKFHIIEQFLLERMKHKTAIPASLVSAIQFLISDPENASTKNLAQKAGISSKHLISLFHQKVGLTPKTLARILRFQKVIHQIDNQEKIDWTRTAHDLCYYDQAHFIKDFYAFSGINPSKYPHQKGDYINYLPLD